ncbi:MAG: hypothetical protein ACYCU7_01915 [Acidimicrobiales bacterium]
MCDTLCARGSTRTVFAKNSDRPVGEVQLVGAHPRRPSGGTVRTQYLELPDAGAAAAVLARPTWLWGAEHGVNEHGVAIGNELVFTVVDAHGEPEALIGMDLVRLGLERGRTADEALEAMTSLLERHGQGGVADASSQSPYFSSFLIADGRSGWVLETAGNVWAAKPTPAAAAISNRLSLRNDWTVGAGSLVPGEDFDRWRDPATPTSLADARLAAGRRFLATFDPDDGSPSAMAAHLRDHGHGPWGAPGAGDAAQPPPPADAGDPDCFTLCWHLRGYQATTSSMIADLPVTAGAPVRGWAAPGSPCVSVYVPFVLAPSDAVVPEVLGDESVWHRLAALRDRVEGPGGAEAVATVRAALDPIEGELWEEAASLPDEVAAWRPAAAGWSRRLADAVASLAGSTAVFG